MPFTQVTDHHQIGTVSTLCADVEHPEATSCKLSHLTWKYRPGTKRVAGVSASCTVGQLDLRLYNSCSSHTPYHYDNGPVV